MNQPASSRAVLKPGEDGFTILLPSSGVYLHDCCCALVPLVSLMVLGVVGVWRLLGAPGWPEWAAWLLGLALLPLFLRPLALSIGLLLDRSSGRAEVVVVDYALSIHTRVIRSRVWTWDAHRITALDEDEGALWVLSEGRLDGFFAGRDRAELRWVAALLRQALRAPADPPALEGEISVGYRLEGWEEARKGFVFVAPGRFHLRPRFKLDDGLGLRPGVALDDLESGSLSIQPDDVASGIGAGGLPVLRIRLQVAQADEPVVLELTCPRLHELRSALDCFWQEPPAEAMG